MASDAMEQFNAMEYRNATTTTTTTTTATSTGAVTTTAPRPIRPKLLKLPVADDEQLPLGGAHHNSSGGGNTSTGQRNRKKNKHKSKDSQRYADDPAYTDDISHLAIPLRRNSGSESARRKSCTTLAAGRRTADLSSGESEDRHQLLAIAKSSAAKKKRSHNKSDDKQRNDDSYRMASHQRHHQQRLSCSTDDSDYDCRGQSLDRSIGKHQKKTLCFKRDRDGKSSSSGSRYMLHPQRRDPNHSTTDWHLLDAPLVGDRSHYGQQYDDTCGGGGPLAGSSSLTRHSRSRHRSAERCSPQELRNSIELHNIASAYLPYGEDRSRSKESLSRFEIGRRLLRGEIGMKSFNYYLVKEGLRSNKKMATTPTKRTRTVEPKHHPLPSFGGNVGGGGAGIAGLSKSDENIYEEIYFVDRRYRKQAQTPTSLAASSGAIYPDCELCVQQQCTDPNCALCRIGGGGERRTTAKGLYEQTANTGSASRRPHASKSMTSSSGDVNHHHLGGGTQPPTAPMAATAQQFVPIENAAAMQQQQQQPVLQYQSYNPNNPGVYKIETTPVAFTSEYNPIHHAATTTMPTAAAAAAQPTSSMVGAVHYAPQDAAAAAHHHHNKVVGVGGVAGNQASHALSQQESHISTMPANVSATSHYSAVNTRTKSSSSSDSLHPHKYGATVVVNKQTGGMLQQQQPSDFYDYPSRERTLSAVYAAAQQQQQQQQLQKPSPHQLASSSSSFAPPTSGATHQQHPQQQHVYATRHYAHQQPPLPQPPPIAPHTSASYQQLDMYNRNIYKTDSRASIFSENMSVKSETSAGSASRYHSHHAHRMRGCQAPTGVASSQRPTTDMSDSASSVPGDGPLTFGGGSGDAARRRYFGSAESCRFGYEQQQHAARRCSYDMDKCSFSDTCRNYECRNCDCSSTYLSSDIDEAAHLSRRRSPVRMSGSMSATAMQPAAGMVPLPLPQRTTSTIGGGGGGCHQRHNTSPASTCGSDLMSGAVTGIHNNATATSLHQVPVVDPKTTRYAEDFIKHIANVKQSSIYQAQTQAQGNQSGVSMTNQQPAPLGHRNSIAGTVQSMTTSVAATAAVDTIPRAADKVYSRKMSGARTVPTSAATLPSKKSASTAVSSASKSSNATMSTTTSAAATSKPTTTTTTLLSLPGGPQQRHHTTSALTTTATFTTTTTVSATPSTTSSGHSSTSGAMPKMRVPPNTPHSISPTANGSFVFGDTVSTGISTLPHSPYDRGDGVLRPPPAVVAAAISADHSAKPTTTTNHRHLHATASSAAVSQRDTAPKSPPPPVREVSQEAPVAAPRTMRPPDNRDNGGGDGDNKSTSCCVPVERENFGDAAATVAAQVREVMMLASGDGGEIVCVRKMPGPPAVGCIVTGGAGGGGEMAVVEASGRDGTGKTVTQPTGKRDMGGEPGDDDDEVFLSGPVPDLPAKCHRQKAQMPAVATKRTATNATSATTSTSATAAPQPPPSTTTKQHTLQSDTTSTQAVASHPPTAAPTTTTRASSMRIDSGAAPQNVGNIASSTPPSCQAPMQIPESRVLAKSVPLGGGVVAAPAPAVLSATTATATTSNNSSTTTSITTPNITTPIIATVAQMRDIPAATSMVICNNNTALNVDDDGLPAGIAVPMSTVGSVVKDVPSLNKTTTATPPSSSLTMSKVTASTNIATAATAADVVYAGDALAAEESAPLLSINDNNNYNNNNSICSAVALQQPQHEQPQQHQQTTFTSHTGTVVVVVVNTTTTISATPTTTNTITSAANNSVAAADRVCSANRDGSTGSSTSSGSSSSNVRQPKLPFSIATEVAGDTSNSDKNGNLPPASLHNTLAASTPNLPSATAIAAATHTHTPLFDIGVLSSAPKSSESNESLPTNNTNNTTTSAAFDSSDILDLPLPAIPVKRKTTATASSRATSPRHHTAQPKEYSSLPTSYKAAAHHRRHSSGIPHGGHASLSASALHRLAATAAAAESHNDDMHYHSSHEKPRYLFGERSHHQHHGGGHAPQLGATGHSAAVQLSSDDDKVYWNHSGWMQVNHQQRSFEKSPHRGAGGGMVANEKRHSGGGSFASGGRSSGFAASFDNHHHDDYHHPPASHQSLHAQQSHDGRARSNALRAELKQHAHSRNSKIEELISRSEARRSAAGVPLRKLHHQHQSIYSIDPQISAILNERPGFLPVKRLTDNESPPPITPIISPPPAFQDTKQQQQHLGRPSGSPSKFHLTVSGADVRLRSSPATSTTATTTLVTSPQAAAAASSSPSSSQHHPPSVGGKGMVFSRSFEYDTRKSRDYKENFSKSFDYDLSATSSTALSAGALVAPTPEKLRSKMFNNLTGVSPNYLTKKENNRSRNSSRDASPVFQQMQPQPLQQPVTVVEPFKPKTRVRNTLSVRPERFLSLDDPKPHPVQGRSRRAQFSRLHHGESSSSSGSQGFRSLDQSVTNNTVNLRLNSCDSGARSDLSNDEMDDDLQSTKKRSKYFKSQNMITKQRSLTPDKHSDEPSAATAVGHVRRALTPERYAASNNPKNSCSDGSQASLFVKHSSGGSAGSRSSTLERAQFEEKAPLSSRSSSSSSYSGGADQHEPMGFRRVPQRHVSRSAENRIRRSRSLQLTERSPNRSASVAQQHPQLPQHAHHILNARHNNAANQPLPPPPPTSQPPTVPNSSNHTSADRRSGHQQSRSPSMQLPAATSSSRSPNVRSRNASHETKTRSSSGHKDQQRHSVAAATAAADPKDKSHSFDATEYDGRYHYQLPYNFKSDFDKSRSFDDDYGNAHHRPGITVTESRSFSNDRMVAPTMSAQHQQQQPQHQLQPKQTSPQSYGSRLYEHEMMYDLARQAMDRSPIMEFRRQQRKVNGGRPGRTSPHHDGGAAAAVAAQLYRPFNRSFDQSLNHQHRDLSPSSGGETFPGGHQSTSSTTNSLRSSVTNNHSSASPASDYEHGIGGGGGGKPHRDDAKRDTDGGAAVTDFLYGTKGRAEASAFHAPSQRRAKGGGAGGGPPTVGKGATGTPSPGSCTASSCDFWPHCSYTAAEQAAQGNNGKYAMFVNVNGDRELRRTRTAGGGGGVCGGSISVVEDGHDVHVYDEVVDSNDDEDDIDHAEDGDEVLTDRISESVPNLSDYEVIRMPAAVNSNFVRSSAMRAVTMREKSVPRTAGKNRGGGSGGLMMMVTSKPPPFADRSKSSSAVLLLPEREMPITRERYSRSPRRAAAGKAMSFDEPSRARVSTTSAPPSSMATGRQLPPPPQESSGGGSRSRGSAASSNMLRPPSHSDVPRRRSSKDAQKIRSPTFQAALVSPIRRTPANGYFGRCHSLPNIILLTSCNATNANNTTGDSRLMDLCPANLSQQTRAISSPSLSEHPLDTNTIPTSSTTTSDATSASATTARRQRPGPDQPHPSTAPGSVLQKLKNTFSQLKGKSSSSSGQHVVDSPSFAIPSATATSASAAVNQTTNAIGNTNTTNTNSATTAPDSTTYRFGPLVWRTSKERRKTKSHRRDKCNSGDSGIQVELDGTDDAMTHSCIGDKATASDAPPSPASDRLQQPEFTSGPSHASGGIAVRRANSAKTASSPAAVAAALRAKLRRKGSERLMVRTVPVRRSHSQPTGLDSWSSSSTSAGAHHPMTITTTVTAADDQSDSDSEDYTTTMHSAGAALHLHEFHQHQMAHAGITYAEVLYPFRPAGAEELALEQGALIEVLHREPGPWWWGRVKLDAVSESSGDGGDASTGAGGWFPKDFVRPIVPLYATAGQRCTTAASAAVDSGRRTAPPRDAPFAEATNCDIRLSDRLTVVTTPPKQQQMTSDATTTTTMTPVSFKRAASESPPSVSPRPSSTQNSELIRLNVIKELLDTEVNYVKLLAALCQGYLHELRQRPEIISTDSVAIIFSNVEQILQFQQGFVNALRLAIIQNRIAETFVEYQSGFMVYSVYCNSYTRALMELETYSANPAAMQLLESCRLSQNLPELPLSAHLLAPVQRICRYPLILSELAGHTATAATGTDPKDDCKETLDVALAAMKHVTEMLNEGKRHSEYLGRIQARFDHFQGPPIGAHSTRLFLQTDAIRMTPNLWNNTYTLFLFDNQLVYCKKDLLKRTAYTYKGRIFLDTCRILNLPDGKMFGMTLKNALRIYCDLRGKWFDFCFRSASSKLRFLSTFAAERKYSGQSVCVSELTGGAAVVDDEGGADGEVADGEEATATMMMMSEDDGTTTATLAADDLQPPSVGGHEERPVDVENAMNVTNVVRPTICMDASDESLGKVHAHQQHKPRGDTLPKKSRKLNKEASTTTTMAANGTNVAAPGNGYEYGSSSLGRKRIGNWFRKAKSTNTTPSQSPTHQANTLTMSSVAGGSGTDIIGGDGTRE